MVSEGPGDKRHHRQPEPEQHQDGEWHYGVHGDLLPFSLAVRHVASWPLPELSVTLHPAPRAYRASLRELIDRMGHSTTRAALIFQHRTSLRDKMIADEISRRPKPSAPDRARSGPETMPVACMPICTLAEGRGPGTAARCGDPRRGRRRRLRS